MFDLFLCICRLRTKTEVVGYDLRLHSPFKSTDITVRCLWILQKLRDAGMVNGPSDHMSRAYRFRCCFEVEIHNYQKRKDGRPVVLQRFLMWYTNGLVMVAYEKVGGGKWAMDYWELP